MKHSLFRHRSGLTMGVAVALCALVSAQQISLNSSVQSDKKSVPKPIARPSTQGPLETAGSVASRIQKAVAAREAAQKAMALAAKNRKADVNGDVLVLMYHHLKPGPGVLYRTPKQFQNDLERLYTMGFRPVTAREYVQNKINIAPGMMPVVLTFDDADPSQFQMTRDGKVTPDCGVGIWMRFAETHPDFPVKGTFFVLPSMWGQNAFVRKKVDLLRSLGSELANHTITHPELRKVSVDRLKREVGEASLKLVKLGEPMPHTLAFPYGSTPHQLEVLKGFKYMGQDIRLAGSFIAGANPSPSPNAKDFFPLRIPRIQVCDGPYGFDWWLKKFKKREFKIFVQPAP